ncbi:NAD(P)H-nitrite reductase large subunit [Desulfofundulus luciae]|uniref:NAD(P)H-nitrite reductase large subunit n=1 Tax=Desulfofundulus luciae TaxID=74702 RepID=A0ABU0B2G0_9FIRM|nr:(2Fe-2S)-binding protein [Desulfofundulus luciae]MDQ0286435.1 NAD(P)H-nitrite reductase large subunit [Desulfofundulus luciae]
MEDKTIVCRCEDVTLEEIRQVIAGGAHTLDEIKRLKRCGMGPCQGRTCRPLIAGEIARITGQDPANVALPTFRPPAIPLKLGTLARGGAGNEQA